MAEPEPEELPPLAVGTVLEDRYRITGELGAGGIGAVYRAEHLKLGHEVAIKALRSPYAAHATMRPRFEREAKALAALKHPHIVTLTDYSVADGTPYLVMELLEGHTLEALLAEGPLEEPVARSIAVQILDALIYAHEEGFVHRDLKPANVFLCELPTNPYYVKILDFGFVQLAFDDPGKPGGLTHSGIAFGTPAYMSPEQATGDTTDARTDLYAFGVILWEMIAGRRPFEGSMPEIVRQQLIEPLPKLSKGGRPIEATKELAALLERATAKDRHDRFESAAALRDALLALPGPWVVPRPHAEDDTLPAAPGQRPADQPTLRVGRAARPAPAARPRRVGLAIFALAVVLGAIGAAIFFAVDAATAPTATAPHAGAIATATPDPIAPPAPLDAAAAELAAIVAAPDAGPPPAPDAGSALAPDAGAADAAPAIEPLPPDPWTTWPASSFLHDVRRRVLDGRPLTRTSKRTLRTLVDRDHADPRPHLVFAQSYLAEGAPASALERYELAHRVDPGARGDPRMQTDLVRLASEGEHTARATALLARLYGPHAIDLVERELAAPELPDERRAALEALRGRLVEGPSTEPARATTRRGSTRRSATRRGRRSTRRRR